MTEKEAYIYEWMNEVSKEREELDGFSVCPYASKSKALIVETPIDDIVPEPGHDVIIFIVEDFWHLERVQRWVNYYNEKFDYYSFFADCASKESFINGIQTNNKKYNLILCQSKQKLSKIRKQLAKTEYYSYWNESYLQEVLGDDYEMVKDRGQQG
jgi:hypothetical protein